MQTHSTRSSTPREPARYARAVHGFALALAFSLATGSVAQAATTMCTAHSPAHRVALIELYSSEGCNSCPPADRWLGQWKGRGVPDSVVPLALHVDYWNSLGWMDRFSQHRFTERQQSLTDLAGGHTIYTPEVFVSGRELRSWSQPSSFESRVQDVTAKPAQADVAIAVAPRVPPTAGALDVDATFTARTAGSDRLNAYVAVYENDLNTQVHAGENSGATLHHERVVRQWIGPVPLVAGYARIHQDVALGAFDREAGGGTNLPASGNKFGVAAFVENAATGEVLQVADLAACH
ncbi:DUF1223 domain-containing protein [Paraburkholderia saeva]|uniref:DUF1223 domain-containing protein n=1 Tax=Paraburkholderia saeva TaxID=2777537 RepID=A0A9N8RWK4_9BURK|nr:hypothetical protein R70241_01499 [Paraburkholderia saeva]CAG4898094.1 hypothetical protein LMG31841_02569 [Paraburkholderia saeva]